MIRNYRNAHTTQEGNKQPLGKCNSRRGQLLPQAKRTLTAQACSSGFKGVRGSWNLSPWLREATEDSRCGHKENQLEKEKSVAVSKAGRAEPSKLFDNS